MGLFSAACCSIFVCSCPGLCCLSSISAQAVVQFSSPIVPPFAPHGCPLLSASIPLLPSIHSTFHRSYFQDLYLASHRHYHPSLALQLRLVRSLWSDPRTLNVSAYYLSPQLPLMLTRFTMNLHACRPRATLFPASPHLRFPDSPPDHQHTRVALHSHLPEAPAHLQPSQPITARYPLRPPASGSPSWSAPAICTHNCDPPPSPGRASCRSSLTPIVLFHARRVRVRLHRFLRACSPLSFAIPYSQRPLCAYPLTFIAFFFAPTSPLFPHVGMAHPARPTLCI